MISQATQFLRNDVILVALLVYAALGLLTDALVRLLERRALAWRRGLFSGTAVNGHRRARRSAVRGLVREFDGRRVLDGLDLDIAPGEFVALLGRQRHRQVHAAARAGRAGPGGHRRARGDRHGRGRVPGTAAAALARGCCANVGPGPADRDPQAARAGAPWPRSA